MKLKVVFTGTLCFFASSSYGQDSLQEKAQSVIESSCGTCHVRGTTNPLIFVNPAGEVQWDTVKRRAADIIEMVETKRMPPPTAPSFAMITDEQREDLLDYVRTLIEDEAQQEEGPKVDLGKLELPADLQVSVLAEVTGARAMAVHASGIIFVGTGAPTSEGGVTDTVYAVRPHGKEHFDVLKFAMGLDAPNGVALDGDDLYVAEATRIIVFRNAVQAVEALAADASAKMPSYEVIKDDFVRQKEHYWKYLAIGPDRKLYVPIGADCNVCLADDREATAGIFRLNLDGTGFEQVAKGVRNTVGFDWDPGTGDLWFTDNGRDLLGDDIPSDELNRLSAIGQDFGFPFCFASDVSDPVFGKKVDCSSKTFVKPVVELGAHVAALGMTFYRGDLFPKEYQGRIFVAEHGSWNRTEKSGYRVRVVERADGATQSFTDAHFISGWLDEKTQENWGRPVDVKNYIDGSLLISDDYAGVIYRVTPAKLD